MGVEAITDHVELSPLFDMVPIHQPIVEHHQQLTIFKPDLPIGLAHVVHYDKPMEIHATDEMPSLTMSPILTLDGPPPIRSILDDFDEIETDDNSIMEATTESEFVYPSLRQENQLLHERVSSLVHDKTLLQDRVLLLEARIDRLSLDFSSRLAQASIPAPKPSSGYPFQLPSERTALLTKMSSEMADVKEAIGTSSSNQAFGRAMKYTTIPSSNAHDHCEYFMKQLVEHADRGGLTDDERKPLLGLKLSADKIVKGLPCSNAEYDTPIQSHEQKAFVALIERSNQVQQGFVDTLSRQTHPNYAVPIQPTQPYGFAYQQAALSSLRLCLLDSRINNHMLIIQLHLPVKRPFHRT
ncbi:hypothetical protein DYB31_005551 [Aphanomyces astaci]|uniref:Uncharacterized protein n=1 Tax=Aphanomyces astaci TaxID=112090 RepID=A0A397F556_APHAT|nr:hypothetical protein DYB31_005551 [Aphanomyces astaci]